MPDFTVFFSAGSLEVFGWDYGHMWMIEEDIFLMSHIDHGHLLLGDC